MPRVSAGDFTTIVIVAGSVLRPIGGWLSDRIGGYRLLLMAFVGVCICILAVSLLPALPVVIALLFAAVGLLGMGNGAVFQLVPQRFPDRMGIVTGIVGAAGGLGGFFLPSVLGATKDRPARTASGCNCSRWHSLVEPCCCCSSAPCGKCAGSGTRLNIWYFLFQRSRSESFRQRDRLIQPWVLHRSRTSAGCAC